MVTQTDVAKRAGVSPITVSRVVNGLGNVKPNTREQVEDAIRELGYHPNRQAQALNNGLTHTLAFVTPRTFTLPLYNNFYVMNLLSGLEMRSRDLGWDVLITTDHDQKRAYDFLRVWHQRKVDGLVFLGLAPLSIEQRREIEQADVPCVCICDRIRSRAINWIDTDNAAAARDALERFRALGHRSVAYLGPDMEMDYNPNFQIREQTVLKDAPHFGLTHQIIRTDAERPLAAAQAFLAMKQRPTAILAANDSLAITFMLECEKAGVTAGRDYALIGFDAEPLGQKLTTSLASYRQPLLDMGQAAAEVLVERIKGDTCKHTKLFPMELVEGGSLGPKR